MAPVTGEPEVKVIEAVVDSGAEDSVTPPGVFEGAVVPSLMSKEGRRYRAANGSPIPNLGRPSPSSTTPRGGGVASPSRWRRLSGLCSACPGWRPRAARCPSRRTRARSCTSSRGGGSPW